MVVEKPLTESPVSHRVSPEVPSHCWGRPVGPTGGDSPQAWASGGADQVTMATVRIATRARMAGTYSVAVGGANQAQRKRSFRTRGRGRPPWATKASWKALSEAPLRCRY